MTHVKCGGCQCGNVRYEATVETNKAYLCHCRMCQRATGGFAASLINCKITDRKWIKGAPDYYQSSPIAKRPYCGKCGTPLGFEFLEGEYCDLTIGSFDEPSDFKPASHFGAENLQSAWLDTKELPQGRADEHEPTLERWKKAGMKPPK